jgi:NO-binding membrane sensor protein with MHYT domain
MVELYVEYRAATIALTCAVALIGSYASVSICEQYRIATLSEAIEKQIISLILASLCAGGVCVWAVFYVAMSSYRLKAPSGSLVFKTYDTDLALASIAVTTVLHFAGIYLASTDAYFSKSKREIIEDYLKTTSTATHDTVKGLSKMRVLLLVCTHKLTRILLGGCLSGAALVLMRYMGMASINIPGSIRISPGHIVAHLITSELGCMAGFWIFFRVLSVLPSLDVLRKVVAIYGGIVLAGVQYIGLAGVTFEYDPSVKLPAGGENATITSAHLFIGALIASVMFSFLVLVYVLSDLRGWLLRTRIQLRLADRAILALVCRSPPTRAPDMPTTSLSGKQLTTSPVSPHRPPQAPPEVVQYAREYLKTVTERSATRPAVFTFRHVLYYDVGTGSDADSLSAGREEPPGVPRLLPFDQLVPRTASGVSVLPASATAEAGNTSCAADIENGLGKGSFDDISAAPTVVGGYGYVLPPVRVKPPPLAPSAAMEVQRGITSASARGSAADSRPREDHDP